MKIYSYLFGLFAFFSITIASAQPSSDLAALLSSVQTMRADFTQHVFDNHGKKMQSAKGQMAMERPGKFRWEIKKPTPQTIVANTAKLWIYDPDLEQVTVRTLKHAAGETPAMLLTQNTALDKDFTIQENQGQNLRWFILTPKQKDNMFSSILLGFNGNQIREMKFEDHLGHVTVIHFDKVEMNASLSSALFNFKPPKNADVINEAQS